MTIIIKPTYNCNFRCKYCYLSNDTKCDGQVMDICLAKVFVRQLKDYVSEKHIKRVTLIWHGGEPLLWGVEKYTEIFDYLKEIFCDISYKNSIQTNLSLITDDYIRLFKDNNVHIGFSLDGDREINDSQRIYPNGKGTYDDIMNKVELCRNNGISIGCIVVGSRKHIGRIKELYKFLSANKLNFKFNPLFNSGEAKANVDEYGITPTEYAEMAIELFDLWYNDTNNELVESNFTEIASNIITGKTNHCLFGKNCQDGFFAISPKGDIMPCGRFCDDEYKKYSYGNIREKPLREVIDNRKNFESYQRALYIANSNCSACEFYNICHGGCLHEGFISSGDFKHKTFLCSAYKRIFTHIKNTLNA